MTRAFRSGLIPLVALLAAGTLTVCNDDSVGPLPLTDVTKTALDEAMQDAYRTQYTYEAVIDDFGAAAPFSAVMMGEMSNTAALAGLYTRRDLTPPATAWNAGNVPRFANLQQACMAAEESEMATEMMLVRMLRLNLPADVRQAFEAVRATARNTHRHAFRECAGGTIAPANASVEAAMAEALQEEYRAFYTYARVLADLGNVVPFVNIRDAEWLHIGAAANLFARRELSVPTSTWTLDNVPRFTTVQQACAAAVAGETANVAMYDRLLALTLPVDVARVFEHLRAASRDNHLPAFEACDGT